mgnify:CR=1 FL=1
MKYVYVIIALLSTVFVQFSVFAENDFFEVCKSGTVEEIKAALEAGASVFGRNPDKIENIMAGKYETLIEELNSLLKKHDEIRALLDLWFLKDAGSKQERYHRLREF